MDCSEIRWGKRYCCLPAIMSNARKCLPSKRYFFSHDNSCATAQECIDRTTFKASLHPLHPLAPSWRSSQRHCGVLNRTHTRASSLAKMSAGIPNPCGYIDQPARARLGLMVTAGPAEQPLLLSHNTKSQAPEPSSQSQGARRRWRPKCRRYEAPATAAEEPAMRSAGDGNR